MDINVSHLQKRMPKHYYYLLKKKTNPFTTLHIKHRTQVDTQLTTVDHSDQLVFFVKIGNGPTTPFSWISSAIIVTCICPFRELCAFSSL